VILQLNVVNTNTMTKEQIQHMLTLFATVNGKMKVHAQFKLMKTLVTAQCDMNIANENLAKKTAQFEQGRVEAMATVNKTDVELPYGARGAARAAMETQLTMNADQMNTLAKYNY
jgi:hypothetical protein